MVALYAASVAETQHAVDAGKILRTEQHIPHGIEGGLSLVQLPAPVLSQLLLGQLAVQALRQNDFTAVRVAQTVVAADVVDDHGPVFL